MNFKSFLIEHAQSYSPSDVMSKLAAVDKENEHQEDSVLFGLKDTTGGVIEVRVAADQAEDFESALGRALNDIENPEQPEIAEVLFSMHDQFTIVDVKWPQVIEDEEEDATDMGDVADGEEPMDPSAEGDDTGGDLGDDSGMDDGGMGGDLGADGGGVLDSVLQMMIADAEAKRQEAVARSAEARAKEAEVAAGIADNKLKAEEEVADMEAHYQVQADEQKEAKKLAKLAKYRHDLKNDEMEDGNDDFADALTSQQGDANMGTDTANRDNVEAALEPTGEPEEPGASLDGELNGVENEERSVSNPQFKQLAFLLKYLNSAKVNAVRND